MGNLLGNKDHMSGTSLGDAPGSNSKSRIGQGTGIPKTPKSANPPISVSGSHSYGIRHAIPKVPPSIGSGAAVDKIPKAYKTPKTPKL